MENAEEMEEDEKSKPPTIQFSESIRPIVELRIDRASLAGTIKRQ
jgi:hypothetical protein